VAHPLIEDNWRFAGAKGVPPSHPPRGSLPAGFFRPGRGRTRRRRPPVGSAAPQTRPAVTPRTRAGDHQRHRRARVSSARAHRRQGGVATAPPRHRRLRPGRRLRARSTPATVRPCQTSTLPHHTTATSRGPVRRDSGAVQLVRVGKAGQPSGWPARANPHGRARQSP
jgi:hypothetical protein